MDSIPFSSAAERNRQPILDVLRSWLPDDGTVLEIGSGTGQHAVFLTQNLTGITWQPTDRQENIPGLDACFLAEGNTRILPALKLDVLSDPWPGRSYDAAFSANTAHIMPWGAVIAMFAGVGAHLVEGACFCLYGPFNINNCFTSPSNAGFDAHLRQRDPEMGIRDMEAMQDLANLHQLRLEQKIPMPANNFILVFVKKGKKA